ncbi:hypothetical protein [Archangium violaceum]|uniref:hypothetical protein n=1 Tax=Archangium violaceum TaxID=83451 RepID=UPI0036DBA925
MRTTTSTSVASTTGGTPPGLAPGGHLVRFVVVDTAGMRGYAEVKVGVGDGSCELPQPDAGTDGLDAGTSQPPPVVGDGGCGCGAAPVAPLAWLVLGALALRRGRVREE